MRHNWQLAVLLALAFGLVTYGLFQAHEVAGWIGAGVLLAAWAALFVLDVGEPDRPGDGGDE